MNRRIIISILTAVLLFSFQEIGAQVRVAMERSGGSYKVPCTVNGLRMKFILDTGATVVQLSLKEATFMLENDYISASDIVGKTNTQIADGSIEENTVINLRKMEIGGLTIENVRAVVSNNMESPLLLGLSAINKLGDISIEGNDLVILNAKQYTEAEIEEIRDEAYSFYEDGLYAAAVEKYELLYKAGKADAYDLLHLGLSNVYFDEERKTTLKYLLLAEETAYTLDTGWLPFLYYAISDCYRQIAGSSITDGSIDNDEFDRLVNKGLAYAQKSLANANKDSEISNAQYLMAEFYSDRFSLRESHLRYNLQNAKKYYGLSLDSYCKSKKNKTSKC